MRANALTMVVCGLCASGATAGPIDIPNVFTPSTVARAAAVNENFAVAETAINEHDGRIEDVEGDIATLTTSVEQLRGPVAVFDGVGNEIGLMIGDGTYTRHVAVLTAEGYAFLLSKANGLLYEETFNTLYYTTSNCSGPAYLVSEAGTVVRTNGALYYADRDGTPSTISNGSQAGPTGACANLVQQDAVWPALPNDPAITGVTSQAYQLPIKLGRP